MRRTITALVLAAALLGGCGGDDEDEPAATPEATAEATEEPAAGGGGAGAEVAVASPQDGALQFDPAELSASAGEVTFTYNNPSQVPHAFEIEGVDGSATETITESESAVTVQIDAGEYVFYCPVGQHRQGGMEGTLTVE
jgi:plastocyanin